MLINKLIGDLKNGLIYIDSLNESWSKEKIVFAQAFLPFWTIGEPKAHCNNLQIAQAASQIKIEKNAIIASLHI